MKDSKARSVKDDGVDGSELSCWAKFKRFFDDRGFDLECEYKDLHSVNIIAETTTNGKCYRKFEDINRRIEISNKRRYSKPNIKLDENLPGVVNFYDQLANLSDVTKAEYNEGWKRSSVTKHRVSVRPSISLTNIAEEIFGETEMDDVEEVNMKTYIFTNTATLKTRI